MPSLMNRAQGLCGRLFRFIYRQTLQEQLVFASRKLIDAVMFEAIVDNYPVRHKLPLANPFCAPNNTPEESTLQDFLMYQDVLILVQKKLLDEINQQRFVHTETVKVNNLVKVWKFAMHWKKKANLTQERVVTNPPTLNMGIRSFQDAAPAAVSNLIHNRLPKRVVIADESFGNTVNTVNTSIKVSELSNSQLGTTSNSVELDFFESKASDDCLENEPGEEVLATDSNDQVDEAQIPHVKSRVAKKRQ